MKKWKYIDKQLCDEIGESDFKALKEDLDKDLCSECNDDIYKNCECVPSSIQDSDGYNNVFCAMKKKDAYFACPEACCDGGKGCPEPGRLDPETEPTTASETETETEPEPEPETEPDKKRYISFWWGMTILITIAILIGSFLFVKWGVIFIGTIVLVVLWYTNVTMDPREMWERFSNSYNKTVKDTADKMTRGY